jgi:N-formylglutamate amidohydrolase
MHIDDICTISQSGSSVIATAIHAGHEMRDSLMDLSQLTDTQRLREEDPFTDIFAGGASATIIAKHSRFQVDLNRPRERAVYQVPADAWGLDLWCGPLSTEERALSLREYDLFYGYLRETIDQHLKVHERIVVLDIHSYNHRRMGEKAPFDDPMENPEVIIGTGTMPDRQRWAEIIDAVTERLSNAVVMDRYLDVRENVKFQGGEMAKWLHRHYPETVCCISLEFKKIFMNEWSGRENRETILEIKEVMGAIVDFIETI